MPTFLFKHGDSRAGEESPPGNEIKAPQKMYRRYQSKVRRHAYDFMVFLSFHVFFFFTL